MCGQFWSSNGECCLWFSWAFPLLDLRSHTKFFLNKSEMSIQLGLVMVSPVFGLVGHFTSCVTSLILHTHTYTHTHTHTHTH